MERRQEGRDPPIQARLRRGAQFQVARVPETLQVREHKFAGCGRH
jgi:hypothetical protein